MSSVGVAPSGHPRSPHRRYVDRATLSCATAIGIRSWMRPTSSVAVVVMIVNEVSQASGSSASFDSSHQNSTGRPAPATARLGGMDPTRRDG